VLRVQEVVCTNRKNAGEPSLPREVVRSGVLVA